MKREAIHLSVVEKPNEDYYRPFIFQVCPAQQWRPFMLSWHLQRPLLDPNTLKIPTHGELFCKGDSIHSSWNLNEKFKYVPFLIFSSSHQTFNAVSTFAMWIIWKAKALKCTWACLFTLATGHSQDPRKVLSRSMSLDLQFGTKTWSLT